LTHALELSGFHTLEDVWIVASDAGGEVVGGGASRFQCYIITLKVLAPPISTIGTQSHNLATLFNVSADLGFE
jgi:hypothetical protein